MSMMPDIRDVDFNDIEDVIGYAMLIIAESNELGLFTMNCSKQSREAIELKTIAQKWINTVKRLLMTCSLGDGVRLLDTYDIIHNLAYDKPADSHYLSAYKLRAFEAYLHQDKTIDQYDLYNAINAELRRHNPFFIGKPLDWVSLSIECWIKNFRNGKSIKDLSGYDTIRQVTILLSEDLWLYEPGQDAFKHRLFNSHHHYLENIGELPSRELRGLRQFLYSAVQYLPAPMWSYYDQALVSALLSSTTTNRYYRQSLRLQMKKAG